MKTKFNIFIFSCLFLILACEKENFIDDSSLIGKWTDTIDVKPKGLLVYDLVLNNNATFSIKISYFGVYPDENDQDLSSWSELTGSLEQNDPNHLVFNVKKNVWWDDFFDITPVTEESNTKVFDNCTYKIINNVLELSYTSYPADYPVASKREFVRVE